MEMGRTVGRKAFGFLCYIHVKGGGVRWRRIVAWLAEVTAFNGKPN